MMFDGYFDYLTAFDRNIGFVTEDELLRLRGKTVAIAGTGGVGGAHLMMLTRMGIGGFHLADFDRFELPNFNRQVGATIRTLGRHKVDVMAEMASDINPELRISKFNEGITKSNIDAFLSGVDLFVDGLDFFCQGIRFEIFRRCAELRIPAITAAPLGMGTSYVIFSSSGMSYQDYFGARGEDDEIELVRFAAGLVPRSLHESYLVDPSRMDLRARRVSSSPVGIQLAASVAGTEATKLLLDRGKVRPAPWCHQFDPYLGRWVHTHVTFGYRNPWQRVRTAMLRRRLQAHVSGLLESTSKVEREHPSSDIGSL